MQNPYKTLRDLIDVQDNTKLQAFLNENPNLDLNSITSTKISALWWALTPPKNKEASLEIIKTLIATNRVNPTQLYLNKSLQEAAPTEEIRFVIKRYEDQYAVLNQAGNGAMPELQQLANDAQNTHDTFIVGAIDDSVAALYKTYGDTAFCEENLRSLMDFIEEKKIVVKIDDDSNKEINTAKLNKFLQDPTTRLYSIDDKTVEFTFNQVLLLIWQAAKDTNIDNFVPGIGMNDKDIEERKIKVIEHIILSQNTYKNETGYSEACWMGTRNQLVSSLDCIHKHVSISGSFPLNTAIIQQLYAARWKDFLKDLQDHDLESFTNFLEFYFIDTSRLNPKLKENFNTFASNFRKEIEERNKSQKTPLEDEELKTELNSIMYDPDGEPADDTIKTEKFTLLINIENIPTIKSFNRYYRLKGLKDFKAIFNYPDEDYEQLIADLCKFEEKSLDYYLTKLKDSILETCSPNNLKNLLASNEKHQRFMDSIDNPLVFCQEYAGFILAKWFTPDEGYEIKEDWLWLYCKDSMAKAIPDLRKWLEFLPSEHQKHWIEDIIATYGNKFTENAIHIKASALSYGLASSYLNHLPLNDEIIIEDTDLRGVELSNLDFKVIKFKNCDLRLSNARKNNTLFALDFESNQLAQEQLHFEQKLSFNNKQKKQSCTLYLNACVNQYSKDIKDDENTLKNTLNAELVAAIKVIPDNVSKLKLIPFIYEDDELNREYRRTKYIHKIVTGDIGWMQILQALPSFISSLELGVVLRKKNAYELAAIFKNLPKTITSLELGGCELVIKQNLPSIFAVIPQNIKSLNLDCNDLGTMDNLPRTIAALPKNLTKLNLSGNKLSDSGLPLAKALQNLPKNLTCLDLSSNQLWRANLIEAFKALPRRLKSLSLGPNSLLFLQPSGYLEAAFAKLPKGLKSLNLSNSDFFTLCVPEIIQSLKQLPAGLSELYLACNTLSNINIEDLSRIFKEGIPTNLNALDLRGNELGNKTKHELLNLVNCLPKTIISLNLRENNIRFLNEKEFVDFFQALPDNILDIDIAGNAFGQFDEKALLAGILKKNKLKALKAGLPLSLNKPDSERIYFEKLAVITKNIELLFELLGIQKDELENPFMRLYKGFTDILDNVKTDFRFFSNIHTSNIHDIQTQREGIRSKQTTMIMLKNLALTILSVLAFCTLVLSFSVWNAWKENRKKCGYSFAFYKEVQANKLTSIIKADLDEIKSK